MVRPFTLAITAALLAGTVQAQTAAPVRSGTSAGIAQTPLAPAGSANAPIARPTAPRAKLRTDGSRPPYNLNEGPNKIGPFAVGQDKPRPKNG